MAFATWCHHQSWRTSPLADSNLFDGTDWNQILPFLYSSTKPGTEQGDNTSLRNDYVDYSLSAYMCSLV